MPSMTPLDLPGHSFADQLSALEQWACLVPGTLLNNRATLAENWDARDGMMPIILECVKNKAWNWPAYNDYVALHGNEFSQVAVKDMAEHVYGKFRSNRNALYRKHQMDGLKEFNPFWQLRGCCADQERPDATRTYLADDNYWDVGCAPWRCPKLACHCQTHSLSRREFAQYIEGDGRDDIAAAQLLKTWNEK